MAYSRHTTGSGSRWITPRSARTTLLWMIVLLCGATAFFAAEDRASAMTNEDVVRMAAAGAPIADIVKAIRSAPATAFDLDPDMVVELRRAHVPDAVIDAMRKAQPVVPNATPRDAKPFGAIELFFQKAEGDVPKSTAVAVAKDFNDLPVSLSFFVICFDPLHVPDLWDTKTPLVGFFSRHHLLWFLDTTHPWRESPKHSTIYLDLPESARVEAEAGRHALALGVAGRAGDTPWRPLSSVERNVEVKAGETVRIFLRVRTLKADRLSLATGYAPYITCEIVRIEPPQAPDPARDPNAPPLAP